MNEKNLKTKCLNCNKEFEINLLTAYARHAQYGGDLEVIVKCPHCFKKYVY